MLTGPGQPRVLLAEDSPTQAQALQAALQDEGFYVDVAPDGVTALASLRSRPYDVLVSDVDMPRLNGYELCAVVRGDADLSGLPVLMLTVAQDANAVLQALQHGADSYLPKPVEPGRLASRLRVLLDPHAPAYDLPQDPGRVARFLAGTFEDLSRTHESLQQSEQRYRALFENASDAILVTDAGDHYVAANRRAEELTGYAHHELLRMSVGDLLPESERAVSAPQQCREVGLRHRNGSSILVEYSAATISDTQSQAILRDITQRRALEESRRREHDQAMLRTIAEGTADVTGESFFAVLVPRVAAALLVQHALVAVVDDKGRLQVLAVSRRGQLIVGLDAGLASDAMRKVVSRAQAEGFCHMTGLRAAEADPWLRTLGADCLLAVPMSDQGLLAVLDDRLPTPDSLTLSTLRIFAGRAGAEMARLVSEAARRESESLLRHSQKMESLGQLAGGVAHDFNNLLTAIQGYTHMVIETLDPGDTRRRDLLEACRAGDRAADLVRQLLTFSRKQVVETRVFAVDDVVGQAASLLRHLVAGTITVHLKLGIPGLCVNADPGQLEQVVVNLCVNARDAMPTGGRLGIETDVVEVTAAEGGLAVGRHAVVRVSDTGQGMSAELQQRIFEPFFTTKPPGRGTGLGLATVYGIVRKAGGHLTVESKVGRGSVFQVYLPVVAGIASGVAPSAAAPRPPGNGTVLVVGEDEGIRGFVTRVLLKAGYQVVAAARPSEALALAQQHPLIDVLLTDIVMAEMTGPDLLSALHPAHPRLKAVYMSGFAQGLLTRPDISLEGMVYLEKPFSPAALQQRIAQALS